MPLLSWRAGHWRRRAAGSSAPESRTGEMSEPKRAAWGLAVSAPAGIFCAPAPIPAAARAGCSCGGSRETPVFEGGWCCSSSCMAARVASALAREMDGRGSPRERHRHRIPLGLAMLEQGWITKPGPAHGAARAKDRGGGKAGQVAGRERSASEENVTRALGLQWGCPVLGMESHHPEGLTALVPRLFVDAFGALPLRVAAGRILYLGFEDRLDAALALALERMTGLRGEWGLVRESDSIPRIPAARSALSRGRADRGAIERALAAAFAEAIERTRPVESRLVRVHDCLWLRMCLRGKPAAARARIRSAI